MKYPFLFFVLLSFLLRLFRRSLPLFPFLGRRGFFCIGFASGCASLAIAPSAASRWSLRSQRSGLGREHTRPSRTPSLRLRRKGRRRIQGFYFYVFNVSAHIIYMDSAWRVRCPLSRPSPSLASLVPRDKGKRTVRPLAYSHKHTEPHMPFWASQVRLYGPIIPRP